MTAKRQVHRWRAGVIAAGWGERLRRASPTLKPLVSIRGQTLVDRVLLSLAETSPVEVVIIVNEASGAVKDHVASRNWPFAVRWIVETTESSMHSFLRVVEGLAADGDPGPFLISTVDTIAPPGSYAAFADACGRLDVDVDVALAIAPAGDDEKPLLVRVGADGATVVSVGSAVQPETHEVGVRLTASEPSALPPSLKLRPAAVARSAEAGRRVAPELVRNPDERRRKPEPTYEGAVLATAGYYAVRSSVLREATGARLDRVQALRNFFERLLQRGYRIAAVPVARGVDVDTPSDVHAAETFLERVER